MAKNLKINIKNTQIAQAINLSGIKGKLAKKKAQTAEGDVEPTFAPELEEEKGEAGKDAKEESPRIKARTKSFFAPTAQDEEGHGQIEEEIAAPTPEVDAVEVVEEVVEQEIEAHPPVGAEVEALEAVPTPKVEPVAKKSETPAVEQPKVHAQTPPQSTTAPKKFKEPYPSRYIPAAPPRAPSEKLGPTGRHVKDLIPPKRPVKPPQQAPVAAASAAGSPKGGAPTPKADEDRKFKPKARVETPEEKAAEEARGKPKGPKTKDFKDVKPTRRVEPQKGFDARARHGLQVGEEESGWRKKRPVKGAKHHIEDVTIRPTSLKVRVPISIKDLADKMKLKSSQLVSKLFLQGMTVTLNDLLEDETTLQLLGQDFGCEIALDTSEEERIRITDKTIKEEITESDQTKLIIRPPVVAFMGHVDHGKTSLIDAIRKSNRVAGEAGAITQHIGAFMCSTSVGKIAVLDTPGHEAFSAMRARGAEVTDIVVLVVAGDEGIRQQTVEAIQHAKAAGVTIVVAINKSDKPNFNAETVYRQLAEQDLLPEAWGGQTITVNCSAVTGEGIQALLDMLAVQSEVLELRANPDMRARGTVLESEMHKGLGSVATVLVQNGTLKKGDPLVFGQHWGRVKTMQDEHGRELLEATPSTPVLITGLSGLPDAGEEFIAVKSEREAREISVSRSQGMRILALQQKKRITMDSLLQQGAVGGKKILNIVLRADVQGSLEALKTALQKIESDKVDMNIIFAGVGEVSESDVQLAAASKALLLGFHTQVESHAESLIKQLGVQLRLHDIIYHAIDDVKSIMAGLLDKIAQETERGKALVKATFKSSQHGVIAGCQVIEGSIFRNNPVRVRRGEEVVWKGTVSSLKRVKEDVREVTKGLECGILLNGFNETQENDVIESYEITYLTQEL